MAEKASIWQVEASVDEINAGMGENMLSHLEIRVTEKGADYLKAEMPMTNKCRQPYGILHGGASAVLAESLGSLAANLCVNPQTQYCVGQSINASHLSSVREGTVKASARPVHLGRRSQVWQIDITNEAGKPVCATRLTMAVLER